MIKRPLTYFATEKGRKLVYRVTNVTMLGVGAWKLLPQMVFIDRYVDLVHNYTNGYKTELSEKLQKRFERCIDLINPPPVQRMTLKAFTVCGFDLFHAGATRNKFGAYVGIPANYEYDKIEDVDKNFIMVDNKRLRWNSDMGKQLIESLVLPEKLQIFSICREILILRTLKVYFDCILPSLLIFFIYGITSTLNDRQKLFEKPPILRYSLYVIMFGFGMGLYFFTKDFTQVHYELKVDKQLCDMGPEYMESGVQYYENVLKRNIALRHLLGKRGQNMFTVLGNENYSIRYPTIPIVNRKQYFQTRLNDFKKGKVSEELTAANLVSQ